MIQAQENDTNSDPEPELKIFGTVDQYLRLSGDLAVAFGSGILAPAYTHMFGFGDLREMGLHPGGNFYMGLNGYFTSHIRMGTSIEFSVAKGNNESFSYFLPITFGTFYEFRISSLSFPIGGEIGIVVGSYRELLAVNLIFKGKAGAFWHFSRQWSMGADVSYWIVPQVVWKDVEKSRVGGMFGITLCGQYHF